MNDNSAVTSVNIPKSVGAYILNQELGRGSFGVVYLGTNQFTGVQVAVKVLDKNELQQNENELALINNEVTILKMLYHKNIVKLYEVFESALFIYIVTEYCEGKELFEYIYLKKSLQENEALMLFQEIIDAMIYLHSLQICHRDIKPENVLLSNGKPKLIDFGFSTQYYPDEYLKEDFGTPSYACPEMHKEEEYKGVLADSWSCGVLLYVMVCGYLPFDFDDETKNEELILKGEYDLPDELSEGVKDLIRHLIEVDPNKRYDFDKVKEHYWFNSNNPKLIGGINIAKLRYPIDDRILNICSAYGFDEEIVSQGLEANKYNNATAVYQLCVKTIVNRGMTSISDLISEEFEKYINDKDNLLYSEYEDDEIVEVEEDDYDNLKADIPLNSDDDKEEKIRSTRDKPQPTNSTASDIKSKIQQEKENISITDFDEEIINRSRKQSSIEIFERRNRNYTIDEKPSNSVKCGDVIIYRPKQAKQTSKKELNTKQRNPHRRKTGTHKFIEDTIRLLYYDNDNKNNEAINSSYLTESMNPKGIEENSFALLPEDKYLLVADSNLLRDSLRERNSLRRSFNKAEKEKGVNNVEENNTKDKANKNGNKNIVKTKKANPIKQNNHPVIVMPEGKRDLNYYTLRENKHSISNAKKKILIPLMSMNQNVNKKEYKPIISFKDIKKKKQGNQSFLNASKDNHFSSRNQMDLFLLGSEKRNISKLLHCDLSVHRKKSPALVRDLSFSLKSGAKTTQNRMEKTLLIKTKKSLETNKGIENDSPNKSQAPKEQILQKIIEAKARIKDFDSKNNISYNPFLSNKYQSSPFKGITINSNKINSKTKRLINGNTNAATNNKQLNNNRHSSIDKKVNKTILPITPNKVLKKKKGIFSCKNKSINLTYILDAENESNKKDIHQISNDKIINKPSLNKSMLCYLKEKNNKTLQPYCQLNKQKQDYVSQKSSPLKNSLMLNSNTTANCKKRKKKIVINSSMLYKGDNGIESGISGDITPKKTKYNKPDRMVSPISSKNSKTFINQTSFNDKNKPYIRIKNTINNKITKKYQKSKTFNQNKTTEIENYNTDFYCNNSINEIVKGKVQPMNTKKDKMKKVNNSPKVIQPNVVDLACISSLSLDDTVKHLLQKLKKNNVIFCRKGKIFEFQCMKNGVSFDIEIVQIEGASEIFCTRIKFKNSGFNAKFFIY